MAENPMMVQRLFIGGVAHGKKYGMSADAKWYRVPREDHDSEISFVNQEAVKQPVQEFDEYELRRVTINSRKLELMAKIGIDDEQLLDWCEEIA
jgi:hypothetical protein